jgi:putative transposase
MPSPEATPALRDWPHSPIHRLSQSGVYMVTAGTYLKQKFFNTPTLLTQFTNLLLREAEVHGWSLQARAVFPNHYHFLAESSNPQTLRRMIRELHSRSAIELNRAENAKSRKVWFQYWESQITFQRSFLARLHYVHNNPVHHRIVPEATQYCWCSAGWFERTAGLSFCKTVRSFPIDRLEIPDDFGELMQP